MLKRILLGCALVSTAAAQPNSPQVELANVREDVRGLVQRVNEMSVRIEQLEKENESLRGKAAAAEKSYVTLSQLNEAMADANRSAQAAAAASKSEALLQVSKQMETLAKQTNAAIDSLAKGMAARTPVQTTFSENYPKEGVSYTVQKGDTLDLIAKKTGAKKQDIVNANKIADASVLKIGQTLFIPGSTGVAGATK